MKEKLVVKSNSLIEASYNLTAIEFRILQIVFSEISEFEDSDGFIEGRDFIVTAQDYADLFKTDLSSAYEALQEASNRLFARYFTYQRIWKKPDYVENIKSRWVSKIGYSSQGGQITLKITEDVRDMVGKLKECFTRIKVKQIVDLTSIYALRVFEIINQWESKKKTPVIEIESLRLQLGLLNNEYPRMFDFKKNVLDLAVKQINEHTDFIVKYVQHKTGRKITGFHFEFKYKKGKEPVKPLKKIRRHITKKEAESMAKPGESWELLYKRLSANYIIKDD